MAKNQNPDPVDCTTFALAQIFKPPMITFPRYLSLALQNHLVEHNSLPQRCNDYMKCIKSLSNIQKIDYDDYLIILKICLYLEQFELDREVYRHRLLNHNVKSSNLKECFIINVPSLNNGNSVIVPDDKVTLYEAISKKTIWAKIIKVTGNEVTIQPHSSKDAEIFRDKQKKFNINFRSRHWPLRCCHYALMIMYQKRNLVEIIYPKLKANSIDLNDDIKWINTNIEKNKEQKQAIKKILNKTAYPAPYIIFGPPGTGKTATLVETISQIVKHYPMKNILVCATSNTAVDEITKRLIGNVPASIVYRMYAPSRPWGNVDEKIRPCTNFVDKTAIFLPKEILLLKRIIITTLITSIRLCAVNFRENHFSYIIIDEASQAIEPEMLIPLMITNGKYEDERIESQAQIVIAGDPHQLGPVVRAKWSKHLFGISMLERLMNDCDPYKKQNGKYNPNYITKLVKNYRSHEKLLYVSNKQFYSEELEACGGADTQIALNWSKLPNKTFPMIFQEVLGKEERSLTRSVSNSAEVLVVIQYVKMLINTKLGKRMITPKDIGIVTPFKQQQIQIINRLAEIQLENIAVGTVETFQGQERTVIILSTVRSKIFEHDNIQHIGFLSNSKRFNVALTRAKALMIIVGNPNILCTNDNWKVLWEYCKKHGACIPFKRSPLKPNKIAKLISDYEADMNTDDNNVLNATKISVTVELGKNKKEELSNVLVRAMEKKLTLT
ncbi:putative helicase MOV-10 isoform X1 [Cataglyphis hispanica]|uniref:putative helicase MOV-10 isoform X1 n=1 Tax=Cataglyphis hispanica TaxID=1086592 RepID=UPI0021803452|nr:putative helicase MOV-10 isoform X1 [Cataglyphis hispanica]